MSERKWRQLPLKPSFGQARVVEARKRGDDLPPWISLSFSDLTRLPRIISGEPEGLPTPMEQAYFCLGTLIHRVAEVFTLVRYLTTNLGEEMSNPKKAVGLIQQLKPTVPSADLRAWWDFFWKNRCSWYPRTFSFGSFSNSQEWISILQGVLKIETQNMLARPPMIGTIPLPEEATSPTPPVAINPRELQYVWTTYDFDQQASELVDKLYNLFAKHYNFFFFPLGGSDVVLEPLIFCQCYPLRLNFSFRPDQLRITQGSREITIWELKTGRQPQLSKEEEKALRGARFLTALALANLTQSPFGKDKKEPGKRFWCSINNERPPKRRVLYFIDYLGEEQGWWERKRKRKPLEPLKDWQRGWQALRELITHYRQSQLF